MGAMNRHPSCTTTWRQTTLAAKCISSAHAKLLQANARLEDVLLAEFAGTFHREAADDMLVLLQESVDEFMQAQALIRLSIDTASRNPDDFVEARAKLQPGELASHWRDFLASDADDVARIAAEIKSDRLATAKRFVDELDVVIGQFTAVITAFTHAREIAGKGRLREALESNEVPLQRDFGSLYSLVLQFMGDYLIDSLVATQVSFDQRNYGPLVAVA